MRNKGPGPDIGLIMPPLLLMPGCPIGEARMSHSELRSVTLRLAPLLVLLTLGACLTHSRSSSPALTFALDSLTLVTAIQHGIRGAGGGDVPLVCVTVEQHDPRPELLAVLRVGRNAALRPGSACQVDTTGGPLTGRSLVVERSGSGLRGISVRVSHQSVADTIATFRVSYYQHYRSSADWFCTVRRRGRSWVLDFCQLERIS